jgi:Mrp family chromosome partitioning ATPase
VKLITCITPRIRVNPNATTAKMSPNTNPFTANDKNSVIVSSPKGGEGKPLPTSSQS